MHRVSFFFYFFYSHKRSRNTIMLLLVLLSHIQIPFCPVGRRNQGRCRGWWVWWSGRGMLVLVMRGKCGWCFKSVMHSCRWVCERKTCEELGRKWWWWRVGNGNQIMPILFPVQGSWRRCGDDAGRLRCTCCWCLEQYRLMVRLVLLIRLILLLLRCCERDRVQCTEHLQNIKCSLSCY